jgi:hypothetical protein
MSTRIQILKDGVIKPATTANDRQLALNSLVSTMTTNRVLRSDGSNLVLAQVNLATDVVGVLPPANGGSGSSANFVDLTTAQTIAGVKTFSEGLILPTTAHTSVGAIWRNGANLEFRNNSNTTQILLNSAGNLSNLADKQASINNLVGTVTNASYLRGNGTNIVLSTIQASDVPTLNQNTTGTASNVTGLVAIANGGTGSSTQNFVDLSTNQNIAGIKTFSNTTATTSSTTGALIVVGGGAFGSISTGSNIRFPSTPSYSTDVNVFDEYKEGTFTPTVIGLSTAGTGTYTFQRGNFLKMGRVVFFSAYLAWTAHTGTGNIRITGLPYASINDSTSAFSPVNLWHRNFTLTANNVLFGYVLEGGTSIILTQVSTGGGTQNNVVLPSSGDIMISGLYFTVN